MTVHGSVVFNIPPGHPALAGHFPHDPVVPGVLLLEYVARAARTTLGAGIELTGLPRVNFNLPLRPGEAFEIRVESAGDGIAHFVVLSAQAQIASGRLQFALAPAAT